MRSEIDSWLTAVRMRRFPQVLAAIRAHSPGVPERRVRQVAWSRCAGPLDDVHGLIDVLLGAGLLERRGGLIRLTCRGRRVATQDHQQGGRLLAHALIEAGYFRNQVRRLLTSAVFKESGDLVCRRSWAISAAAQLTGALRCWSDVIFDTHLLVPAPLVDELLATWVLQPVPRVPGEEARQEVGDRAEAYSYRFEQERTLDPSRVQWIALDDDSAGYDIRNVGTSPARCIEVKGSQGREVRFLLSSNEWVIGHKLGDAYEVHFWGGVSLTRPRMEEYRALRKEGYPRVFINLAANIASGTLAATASQYLLTVPVLTVPVGPGQPQEAR